jgi:hypothetical protein
MKQVITIHLHQNSLKTTFRILTSINNKIYFKYTKEFLKISIKVSLYKLSLKFKEGKNPDISYLRKLAKKYHIKELEEIIDKVKDAVSCWEKFAKEVAISQKVIKMIDRFLKI